MIEQETLPIWARTLQKVSIGRLVNKACDYFDHPSSKPAGDWPVKTLTWSVYSIAALMGVMVLCLVYALTVVGITGYIADFLFPIRDGFWITIGTFAWHWALILLYVLLVLSGCKGDECQTSKETLHQRNGKS